MKKETLYKYMGNLKKDVLFKNAEWFLNNSSVQKEIIKIHRKINDSDLSGSIKLKLYNKLSEITQLINNLTTQNQLNCF